MMKNIKNYYRFITEEVESTEIIEQKPQVQKDLANKIELKQGQSKEWRDKIDPSITYKSCEIYKTENGDSISINDVNISLNGEEDIMINYPLAKQDTELEKNLEELKQKNGIVRLKVMSNDNLEGIITRLANLKSITK